MLINVKIIVYDTYKVIGSIRWNIIRIFPDYNKEDVTKMTVNQNVSEYHKIVPSKV